MAAENRWNYGVIASHRPGWNDLFGGERKALCHHAGWEKSLGARRAAFHLSYAVSVSGQLGLLHGPGWLSAERQGARPMRMDLQPGIRRGAARDWAERHDLFHRPCCQCWLEGVRSFKSGGNRSILLAKIPRKYP